ncbi:MAG: helix-turn-helix transcriptional regulator [Methylomonas sp.]|nr:helix-turn-helix transcriptional regulator [Methylomonas sp.]
MYAARELVDISQEQAAKLLNTSKQAIADAEAGRLNPMPLKLLKGAAELYGVSSDWLLGIVDDWERDPQTQGSRDFLSGLYNAHLRHYAELVARQDEIQQVNAQALAAIQEIIEAFGIFQNLNPEFQDQMGGARLLKAIKSAETINARLTRENTGKPQLNTR